MKKKIKVKFENSNPKGDWIVNCKQSLYRRENYSEWNVETGPPVRTKKYTSLELMQKGYLGVYHKKG